MFGIDAGAVETGACMDGDVVNPGIDIEGVRGGRRRLARRLG